MQVQKQKCTVLQPFMHATVLEMLIFRMWYSYLNAYNTKSKFFFTDTLWHISESISAINSTKRLVRVEVDNHPIPLLRGLFLLTVVLNILGHTYLMYNDLFFFKYSKYIIHYFFHNINFIFDCRCCNSWNTG